jgi:hypothetical protein
MNFEYVFDGRVNESKGPNAWGVGAVRPITVSGGGIIGVDAFEARAVLGVVNCSPSGAVPALAYAPWAMVY